MRRPLLLVLPGILGGVWLECAFQPLARLFDSQNASRTVPFVLMAVYACLLGLWGLLYRLRQQRLATCALCVLAVVIGMSRYAIARYVPPNHIARLVENEIVTIEGRLYRPVELGRAGEYDHAIPNESLYVAVAWLELDDMRYRVQGNIRITLTGSTLLRAEKKALVYGDVIRTRLRLKRPRNLPNFDYREYLRRRDIYLIGTLRHDRYIARLPDWQGNRWLARLYAVRQRIVAFFASYAVQHPATLPTLQVLQAMTLGTSQELSPEIQEIFRNSGLFHLLVVSGIHIGIVAGVLHRILRMCGVPRRYRIVGIVPILLGYAGLSGFQFPVLRAVIMAAVLYAAVTFGRVTDALYSLGFAVTVLVLMSPDALFDASFQMTVAATAAILIFYRCWSRTTWGQAVQHRPLLIRIPLVSLLVSCGAMLGIAPLLIYYYQSLSLYSPISNLAAFVFVTPLLPLTLFTEFLALMLPWNIVTPLLTCAVWLGHGLVWVAGQFPPFAIPFPQFRPIAVWVYYIGIFGTMMRFLHRKAQPAAEPDPLS